MYLAHNHICFSYYVLYLPFWFFNKIMKVVFYAIVLVILVVCAMGYLESIGSNFDSISKDAEGLFSKGKILYESMK